MPHQADRARSERPSPPSRLPWIAFSAALAATMMDLLDATIAHVAAPAIRDDLGGSYAVVQWISAGYTLAMAVMLLAGGRLGDMYGRKNVLLVGAAGFTIASLICAVAPSIETLVGARVLQGAFGAVMVPQVFGLIRDLFGPDDMRKAWAVLGPVSGLSAVLGPVLSGALVEADVLGTGWRMIFLINLPVGIYVLTVGRRYLPDVAPTSRGARLDVRGVALAALATGLLIFPLVQGRELGWPIWSIAMAVASFGVLGVLARQQAARRRAGAPPLLEPGILANRSFVWGVAFATVFLSAMGGLMLAIGALLQIGLGLSTFDASIAMAPYALGGFVGAAIGAVKVPSLGRGVLQLGLVVKTAGVLGLYLTLDASGADVRMLELLGPLVVAGIGMGMVFAPLFDIILAGVRENEVGSASGLLQALQQLGMTLGVAVLGTLFFGVAGEDRPTAADFTAAGEWTALAAVALLAAAFALAFRLPRHARPSDAVVTDAGDGVRASAAPVAA